MKKEIADQWVAALRSGKYQQGKQYLQNSENRFCCLGVLCDISGLGKWDQLDGRAKFKDYVTDNDIVGGVLSLDVKQWAGMYSCSGIVRDVTVKEGMTVNATLAELNDTYDWNFEQIADLIEKKWKEL